MNFLTTTEQAYYHFIEGLKVLQLLPTSTTHLTFLHFTLIVTKKDMKKGEIGMAWFHKVRNWT